MSLRRLAAICLTLGVLWLGAAPTAEAAKPGGAVQGFHDPLFVQPNLVRSDFDVGRARWSIAVTDATEPTKRLHISCNDAVIYDGEFTGVEGVVLGIDAEFWDLNSCATELDVGLWIDTRSKFEKRFLSLSAGKLEVMPPMPPADLRTLRR